MRLAAAGPRGFAAARQRLHRHAVRTGLAARTLTPSGLDSDQALAAGLVHNIGLTVLGVLQPAIFQFLLDARRKDRGYATSRSRSSASPTLSWEDCSPSAGAPRSGLITVIMNHDDEQPHGLSAVVQLADLLARSAGVGIEAPEAIPATLAEETEVDLDAATERLGPLFQAEGRRENAEDEPPSSELAFASALDTVAA
jgi:hypothetical protein